MKSIPRSEWGLVHDGVQGIGMFRCAQALLYDGGKGSYLQAHGDEAWQPWSSTRKEYSAWLWIGAGRPVEAMQQAMKTPIGGLRDGDRRFGARAIEAARRRLAGAAPEVRRQSWWQVLGAEQLELQGRLSEAVAAAAGKRPKSWSVLNAGDLGLILDGPRLLSLFDSKADVRLAPPRCLPLFALTLRNAERKEELRLESDAGFADFRADAGEGRELVLRWQQPLEKRLGGLRVIVRWWPTTNARRFAGSLRSRERLRLGSLRVVFPQVAVADLGPQAAVLFPKAAGEVQRGVWQRAFRFSGTYPGGWTSMQFLAAYDETARRRVCTSPCTIPGAARRTSGASRRPAEHSVVLAFDHPAAGHGPSRRSFRAAAARRSGNCCAATGSTRPIAYRDWVRQRGQVVSASLAPTAVRTRRRGCASCPAGRWASGRPSEWCRGASGSPKYLGVRPACTGTTGTRFRSTTTTRTTSRTKPGFAEGVRDSGSGGRVRHAVHQRPAVGHARRGRRRISSSPRWPGRRSRKDEKRRAVRRDLRQQGDGRQLRCGWA